MKTQYDQLRLEAIVEYGDYGFAGAIPGIEIPPCPCARLPLAETGLYFFSTEK